MRPDLQKNVDGMLLNLQGHIKVFSNPNVPKSKMVGLLGVQKPGPIASISMIPYDDRFKGVIIWNNIYDQRKVSSVGFHFPDYPLPLSKVKEFTGEFTCEWDEVHKYSLFKTAPFPEENPILDFSFVLHKVKMEYDESSNTYTATPVETPDQSQKVTEDMIWIDNYTFYMKDRDPVPDPDAKRKRNRGGMFGV